MISPVRIGVSRCLLGEAVRYDGGHKRDRFVTDVLSRYVEWVPVCPEVEAGLGTPREAMRLTGHAQSPQLITIKTGRDLTRPLAEFTDRRVQTLEGLELSGYIFKKDSPTCGIERVKLYTSKGMPGRAGVGIFARAFIKRFPLVPIEDEGRLCDPVIRDNFVERIFCYHRWQQWKHTPFSRHRLVMFHTIHKYLLMSHGHAAYQSLGRLVAQARRYKPKDLVSRYGALFMAALAVKATRSKQVNVLQHLVGHVKHQLQPNERAELDGVIGEYQQGFVPLIVPITLIKHYVTRYDVAYIRDQVYLNPHPKELMLRNYV